MQEIVSLFEIFGNLATAVSVILAVIIYFKDRDRFVYLPFKALKVFWERMEQGGPKHFK